MGSVTASSTPSAEEAEIADEVTQLLHENEVLSAIALLEDNNVEHQHIRQYAPMVDDTNTTESGSGGVSTDDFYVKSKSSMDLVTYYESGNEYKYGTYWDLVRENADYDGPKPEDVAVLAFDNSHFDYVVGSVNHYGQLGNGSIYDDQTNLLTWPSKANAEHRDRAVVSFNDGDAQVTDASGYLEMNVTGSSGTSWLSANYTHTWSVTNTAQWQDILGGISVSLGGLISISVPNTADSWELNDEVVA